MTKLAAIQSVATLGQETLEKLRLRLHKANVSLDKITRRSVNYSTYSAEEQNETAQAVKYAQLVKAMIDAPILNKDGSLIEGTAEKLKQITAKIG